MSAKKVFFATLLGMCWDWCTVQGQGLYQPGNIPAPVQQNSAVPTPAAQTPDHEGTGLSSWITYDRGNCCVSSGGGPPISTETVLRNGLSFPMGGEYFGRNLKTGWMIEGAVRALFFNQEWSRAWVIELGISNTYNPSHNNADTVFLDRTFNRTTTAQSLNRTYGNLVFGREWYLGAPANGGMDWTDWRLRFGTDFGGRFGSEVAQFVGISHRTDVTEGFVFAIHADMELPIERLTFLAGIRTEYAYSFSEMFSPKRGNMQDITFLFNLGFRFGAGY